VFCSGLPNPLRFGAPSKFSRENKSLEQYLYMPEQQPNQATQLRLTFAASFPSRISLDLAGMTLLVSSDRPDSELFSFLAERGLEPEFRPGVGVSTPARKLSAFTKFGIPVHPSEILRPLWLLVENPPPTDLPATVEKFQKSYIVSWESLEGVPYDELIPQEAAPLLGLAELPIVATDDVWLELETNLPTLGPSGTASLTHDGYIEISTSRPQLLETSKLPGLFKISTTSFGTCSAYIEDVLAQPGIRWSGTRPSRRRALVQTPNHLALAPHLKETLPGLVSDLSLYGSKAVVWESGLGRRVLVLAALEMLDAYPATVLCPPQSVWLWSRHVEMVSRTCSLTSAHADIQLVTYHDLAHRTLEPQAIIFDDLGSLEAAQAWPAIKKLNYLADAYRIALEDVWPDDPTESLRLLEALKPSEFRSDLPLVERYPVDPVRRLSEHSEVYIDRRSRIDTADLRVFKRSSVRVVELSSNQEVAIAAAASKSGALSPSEVFVEILEIISAGPSTSISPKVAAAAFFLRECIAKGRSVVVLTRHKRTANLLKSMLRPNDVPIYDTSQSSTFVPKTPSAIVRFDLSLPSLVNFDEVLVLDYPWSFASLDRAVGSSSSPTGPDVTVIHAANSVDDRIALWAARRGEVDGLLDNDKAPGLSEISYLLTPRR
jgi:hypothetical protein